MLVADMRTSCGLVIFGLAVAAMSVGAFAVGDRLAYSEKLDLEVLTRAQGNAWCNNTVDLDVLAGDAGVFNTEGFTVLAPKLGEVVASRCPHATSVTLHGKDRQASEASVTGTLRREDGWRWRGADATNAGAVSLDDIVSSAPTIPLPGDSSDHIAAQGFGSATGCSDARLAAYRDAVQKAVGVFIDSATVVQNFELINDTIINYSDGYIDQVEVVSEQQDANGLCRVVVDAQVRSTKLQTRVDEIRPQLTKVSNNQMVSIEATIKTKADQREAAIALLAPLIAELPEKIYKYTVQNVRAPTEIEARVLYEISERGRTKSLKINGSNETFMILEVKAQMNDAYIDRLFSALSPILSDKTDRPDIGKVWQGRGNRLVDRMNPKKEPVFFGLTNKRLQSAGEFELSGYTDGDIGAWVASAFVMSFGLLKQCEAHAIVKFYDNSGAMLLAKSMPFFGARGGSTGDVRYYYPLASVLADRRSSTPLSRAVYVHDDSWVPYSSITGNCTSRYAVFSKEQAFDFNVPIVMDVNILNEIDTVSAEPTSTPYTMSHWNKYVDAKRPQ